MMTKAQLVTLLKSNIADTRLFAVKLFLEELITRQQHSSGIEQHRVYTLVPSVIPGGEKTKNYITTLEELLTAITPSDIKLEYMYGSFKVTGSTTPPVSLTLTNLIVELDHASDEDEVYIRHWGGSEIKKQLAFTLTYVNDNDAVLPLKIVNVILR